MLFGFNGRATRNFLILLRVDAPHPVYRPRKPGRRGTGDAAGPRPQQSRARPRLLGLQLRLCPVSASRGLVLPTALARGAR